MLLQRGPGLLERGQRVIPQQHPQLGIKIGAAIPVQGLEPVQPHRGMRSGAHADLQQKNLRGQLLLAFHVFEQLPEIGRTGSYRFRQMSVGLTSGQRLLITLAGGLFPIL